MNLNQLTVFHEVMTTGSISQAARNLGRTQPAVSLALKGLEETLGFQLFERQGRALVLVPEAQYLLTEARDILSHVSDVSRTLQN
ncbi:MAG: LysR family transcriptional regulator [Sedimentitalea sp.]